MEIPSRLGFHRLVMVAAAHVAGLMGFSGERIDDLELAVGEACINAIEHGNRLREELPVRAVMTASAGALQIEIMDRGTGLGPEGAQPPDIARKIRGEEHAGGLGLFLIGKLVDEYEFASGAGEGSTVRLVIRLGGGGAPGAERADGKSGER